MVWNNEVTWLETTTSLMDHILYSFGHLELDIQGHCANIQISIPSHGLLSTLEILAKTFSFEDGTYEGNSNFTKEYNNSRIVEIWDL